MNFVSLAGFRVIAERELILAGDFFGFHDRDEREDTQSGNGGHITFYLIRVFDSGSHHLVAPADADHFFTFFVCPDDCLRDTVFPDIPQIGDRVFCPRQDDNVGFANLFHVIRVVSVESLVPLQRAEVREIGKAFQEYDGHVYFTTSGFGVFGFQRDGIFLFNINVLEIGNYADDRNAREIMDNLSSLVEEGYISSEFVDDNTFDQFSFFCRPPGTWRHSCAVPSSCW